MAISLPTLILIILSFLAFMLMMRQSFFEPIRAIKAAREKKMHEDSSAVQQLLNDKITLERNYDSGIQEARRKSQALIQEHRLEAKKQADVALTSARDNATQHLQQAAQELGKWREETTRQLAGEKQSLASHILNRYFPQLQKSSQY